MSTILVVDDRALNREFLATLLGYAGYRVIEACDGAEALVLAGSTPPDLIISDILMPTMDGVELATHLHADPALASIPIIFYTATYRVQESRALAGSCGVETVLAKPSEPAVILATVAAVLGQPAPEPAPVLPTRQAGSTVSVSLAKLGNLRGRLQKIISQELELIGEEGELPSISGGLGRAFGQFQSSSLRLTAVLELGLDMAAERDRQRLLQLFCRAAQDIMNAKYAVLGLVEEGGTQPANFVACGIPEEVRAFFASLDPRTGLLGQVLGDSTVRRLGDLGARLEALGFTAPHPPIKTFLAVPVLSATRSYGWLYLADRLGGDEFSEEDEEFATTLAAQLALAYGNLCLYSELDEYAAQLESEIVERRRAEEALRESEERHRLILETSTDAVLLVGEDNCIVYANRAVSKVFGYAPDELVGRVLTELQPRRLRAMHLQAFEHYLRSGEKTLDWRHIEVDALHRDGHEFPVEISFSELFIDQRRLFAGFVRDISVRRAQEEELRAREEQFRSLAQSAVDAIVTADGAGTIVFWNGAAQRIFGYTAEEMVGQPIFTLMPKEYRTPCAHGLKRYAQGGAPKVVGRTVELTAQRKGEVNFPVDLSLAAWRQRDRVFFTAILRDISERREQQDKIARLSRIRAVLSGINSAIVRLHDRQALFAEACRVAVDLGQFGMAWIGLCDAPGGRLRLMAARGFDPEQLPADRLAALAASPAGPGTVGDAMRRQSAAFCNDIAAVPDSGVLRSEALALGHRAVISLPLMQDAACVGVLVLYAHEVGFFDDEELRLLEDLAGDLSFALQYIAREEQLNYLAYYDPLTGLANGLLFQDRLGQFLHAVKEGESVAVVILDLDQFTHLNESLGRQVGDSLLRLVAERLTGAVREPRSLARISADTFAVALAGLARSTDAATVLEEQILAALHQTFLVAGRSLRISAHAGIAVYPDDGNDAASLFQNAEAALKQAKSAPEICRYLYYAPEINRRLAAKINMETSLRTALAEGQFVLHYQPQVDLLSGQIVGAEALIRWQHPENGLVQPKDFIAIAEETGLIVDIGRWVVHAACAQQAAWRAEQVETVPVAVNLSASQFHQGQVSCLLREALATHSLATKYLELELTESVVMQNTEEAVRTLQEASQLGLRLSLDDFGTGYSSLAYLKRFPFDFVKIDQSFVANITTNPEDAAIATAVIAMAHRLQLRVIAEGVESEGQLAFLRRHGCDQIQGYYFSRPLPADEFAALLRCGKSLPRAVVPGEEENTVLLVDADVNVLAALNHTLQHQGYRVLTAASARQGLDLLAVNRVQVIIAEQCMPDMSGTEFFNIAKQLYPDTIRIILTGYTELEAILDAVNRGAAFKFLLKPWDDDLLRGHVRDALRRYAPPGSLPDLSLSGERMG